MRTILRGELLNTVGAIVAVGLLLLVAATTIMVHLSPIPASNEVIVGQIQGSLWTAFMMVVSFLFGTSMGRTKQDDTINKLAKRATSSREGEPDTTVTTTVTTEHDSEGS